MNIKLENKQRLKSLINHRNKILGTIYPDHCQALKKSILEILGGIIKKRSRLVRG